MSLLLLRTKNGACIFMLPATTCLYAMLWHSRLLSKVCVSRQNISKNDQWCYKSLSDMYSSEINSSVSRSVVVVSATCRRPDNGNSSAVFLSSGLGLETSAL